MNLNHFKYAVEVARTGSITKAAENLFIGQPSLSRAIKELEDSIGIVVFKRTPKGIVPTAEGNKFLTYAYGIVEQLREVESMYMSSKTEKIQFQISVPRASYISFAFKKMVAALDLTKEIEIDYKETNSLKAINNILYGNYTLGIIRYQKIHEKYFLRLLKEKKLKHQTIWDFEETVIMSNRHPLAKKELISDSDLNAYLQIAHGDPYVPSLNLAEIKRSVDTDTANKRIYVYERASQFEILCDVPATYMWVSPIPATMLDRHQLVQRKAGNVSRIYSDLLIFHENYKFTSHDHAFVEELLKSRDEVNSLAIQ